MKAFIPVARGSTINVIHTRCFSRDEGGGKGEEGLSKMEIATGVGRDQLVTGQLKRPVDSGGWRERDEGGETPD